MKTLKLQTKGRKMARNKKGNVGDISDNDGGVDFQSKIREKDEMMRQVLIPHEGRIMWLQSLLVWEHPHYSAILFITINILFWVATYLRAFYLIGIGGFCATTWDLWSHYVWPEIRVPPPSNEDTEDWTPVHPKLMSVPEICQHLSKVIAYVEYYFHSAERLRKQRPAKFFVFAVTFCLCSGTFGCYVPGIYLVYFSMMGVLLLPMAYYHDVHTKFQESVNPFINKMEDSMNIRRKKSKKSRKKTGNESMDSSTQEFSDSDEELKSFLPKPMDKTSEKDSQFLLRLPSVKDSDSDSGLTPRMTPNPPEASLYLREDDSQEGVLPYQMPSITGFDDSLSLEAQYAVQSQSQLTLGDISDNDTLAEGLQEEDFDSFDGRNPSRKSSEKEVSLHKEVLKKTHAGPTAPLEFDSEYFEDSDSGSKTIKKKKSSKKAKEQVPTLEDELAQGLEFDSDDDQQVNENEDQGISGQNNMMGNLLAGALTGAHSVQDTVANIVASQMVSSIMQNTVSGLHLLGESVGMRSGTTTGATETAENTMAEKGTIEEQLLSKEKVKVKGQGSQDSNDIADGFEFLDDEDFD